MFGASHDLADGSVLKSEVFEDRSKVFSQEACYAWLIHIKLS